MHTKPWTGCIRSRCAGLAITRLISLAVALTPAWGQTFRINSLGCDGSLTWSDAAVPGVCTLEGAASVQGPWTPLRNVFATAPASSMSVGITSGAGFFRLRSADIAATPQGFANLISAYGILETVAGKGESGASGVNAWRPQFEGGPATEANLSRPHNAMADAADNIYIADKDSHSILKVTPDGRIHTVAGTHQDAYNGDGPAPGTTVALSSPNGLWVRGDGTVYILDMGNGRIRRLAPDGILTTMVTVPGSILGGRGLWVSEDESVIYFSSLRELRQCVSGQVSTLNGEFSELGNIVFTPKGELLATDRQAGRVYRVETTGPNAGQRTSIAGNGTAGPVVEGTPALNNGLPGLRGVWPLPNGACLLATHEGSQVLYMDAAGMLYVLVNGSRNAHSGDGQWFYSPGYKISEVRNVTADQGGNILITENDRGYIRRIRFLRLPP